MQAIFRSGFVAVMILVGACSPKQEAEQAKQAAERGEKVASPKAGKEEKGEKGEREETAARGEKSEEGKKLASASEGGEPDDGEPGEGAEAKEDFVTLSDQQIRAARIDIMPVRKAFAGAVEAPAVIAADPKHAAVVSSAVGGRVIEIRRNLGDPVARGDVLAVIESREVAQLRADAEIARRQHELSQATFVREERLYAEKVTSRQEFDIARNAALEARTRLRLAEQQLAAAGGASGGQFNRLMLRSPIKGNVTARQIALGDIVTPDAHLFEVADLNELAIELSLSLNDTAGITVGSAVDVSSEGRTGTGRITHVSRVLDPATRQVRALARLATGGANWRVGETVKASIALQASTGGGLVAIPKTAVQTVEDKPSVFVREKNGFAIKHIVLGATAAGYVRVVSGLSGEEKIAVSNTYVLKAEHGKGEAGDDD